jgi:hypothetical protein
MSVMPSHYSSLGFRFRSADELGEFAERATDDAEVIETPRGAYYRWRSATGAEIWFQVDNDNQGVGAHPHFGGSSAMPIRATAAVRRPDDTALDGAFHVWANPGAEADSGDYPFVFDCANFCEYADVSLPATGRVQLAAFAHALSFFDSEAAYMASQQKKIRFASRSFIPASVFTEKGEPPRSEASFTGHVLAAETKRNEAFGLDFLWASVETLGGVLDVVADPALLGITPKAGGILHGTFWLSGHVLELAPDA